MNNTLVVSASSSSLENTGVGEDVNLDFQSQHYCAMDYEQDNWEAEDYFCCFCHSNDNCEVDIQIHYTLFSSCRSSDPTLR
jgi:hypothetical protein